MTKPKNMAMAAIFIIFMSLVIFPKAVNAAEAAAQEASQEENKIEYKSEDLRNPFEEEKIETKEEPPEEKEAEPLPALRVQGIVWGGSVPQAIINDKVVRVGDTIEGVRITDINKSGVSVFFGNRQHNLTTSLPTTSKESKDSPRGPKDSSQGFKNNP